MKLLKSLVLPLIDIPALLAGGLWYAARGASLPSAYQAMIRLFCRTGGVSNDVMSRVVRAFDERARLPAPTGQLGVTDNKGATQIADRIREDGYYIFPQRLSDATCDRLLQFALQTPAIVRPPSGSAAGPMRLEVYDREAPLAVRYDFRTEDILALADVQDLMTNPAILAVAEQYLQATPIVDVVNMWWHTGFSHQPDADAAQFFHFDMDRIQWLKFFINLTDVDVDSGPHCFVKGSHRTHGIPRELLSAGYARLSDEAVLEHYPRERIIEFTGRRGTILAEDTRGLHKGLAVNRGDRLMLQVQFSNSLFGGIYPPAAFRTVGPSLDRMIQAHPRIYRNYRGAQSDRENRGPGRK